MAPACIPAISKPAHHATLDKSALASRRMAICLSRSRLAGDSTAPVALGNVCLVHVRLRVRRSQRRRHPGQMNDKGLVTADRQIKKDAFYFYRAKQIGRTTPSFTSARTTLESPDRRELTQLKVYSNCDTVAIYLNRRFLGRQNRSAADRVFVPGAGPGLAEGMRRQSRRRNTRSGSLRGWLHLASVQMSRRGRVTAASTAAVAT